MKYPFAWFKWIQQNKRRKCGNEMLFVGLWFLPQRHLQPTHHPDRMSYGSIDGGSFGSRNPFGGPTRQGYQPVGKNISVYSFINISYFAS